MKKAIHYALILDQSGSMFDLKDEVISSFNEQVEMIRKLQQKDENVEIRVTLCVFNDTIDFRFNAQPAGQLKKLTVSGYRPDSCTALYDAIGVTFLKISKQIHSDDQVFVAIFTDGLENASTDYTADEIRHKLKKAERKGWKIRFFCRYEDALSYKDHLNIPDTSLRAITPDKNGIKLMEKEISYCLDTMIGKPENK